MSEQTEQLTAGIWLSKMTRSAGLGNKMISYLLEQAGGILPLFTLNEKTIQELIAGPPGKIERIRSFLNNSSQRIEAGKEGNICSKKRIRIMTCLDDSYPDKLKNIASAPALLYYCGDNAEKLLRYEYGVAIVGTRTPTAYGEAVTKKIVSEIAQRNIMVISGMARGIDSLAHQTTLENHGMTIAVLGCGLDIVYPPENKILMERIGIEGLLLSECPPGTQPYRSYFPARNRIISGLSDCVAVMEASKKSGTMITAGYAGEQGRDLFAVPGSIFSTHSAGTNQLIQDGACVLTSADDLLWKIPFQSFQRFMDPDIRKSEKIEKANPTIRSVLLYTEKTLDEIAQALAVSVPETAEILSILELSGEIILRNGRFSLTESYK